MHLFNQATDQFMIDTFHWDRQHFLAWCRFSLLQRTPDVLSYLSVHFQSRFLLGLSCSECFRLGTFGMSSWNLR